MLTPNIEKQLKHRENIVQALTAEMHDLVLKKDDWAKRVKEAIEKSDYKSAAKLERELHGLETEIAQAERAIDLAAEHSKISEETFRKEWALRCEVHDSAIAKKRAEVDKAFAAYEKLVRELATLNLEYKVESDEWSRFASNELGENADKLKLYPGIATPNLGAITGQYQKKFIDVSAYTALRKITE